MAIETTNGDDKKETDGTKGDGSDRLGRVGEEGAANNQERKAKNELTKL